MKTKFLFLFFFGFGYTQAQDYKCIQAGAKRFFINSGGYMRGVRVDSFHASADSIVWSMFHTPRGSYPWSTASTCLLDTNGASWLGERPVQYSDGLFCSNTMWGDTIKIRTQANIGDVWTFYDDTSRRIYRAEMVGKSTISIFGITDTIKKIVITAYDDSGIVYGDPGNNLQVFLTKNHGFYKIFDLYTFPYHAPNNEYTPGQDFYLDKACNSTLPHGPTIDNTQFTLVDRYPYPRYEDIFHFTVGNVLQYTIFDRDHPSSGIRPYQYLYFTISSQILVGSTIENHYWGWIATQKYDGAYVPDYPYLYNKVSVTGSFSEPRGPFTDSMYMPEEFMQPDILYYFPKKTSFCLTANEYGKEPNNIVGSLWNNYFDSSAIKRSYKVGLGLINHNWYRIGGSQIEDTTLVYHKRGTACGVPISPAKVDRNGRDHIQSNVVVYPNPADRSITIAASVAGTYKVALFDLQGIEYLSTQMVGEKLAINTNEIPDGVYTICVVEDSGSSFTEQVIISH